MRHNWLQISSNTGIAVFNQIAPVANPQGRGRPTTRRALQIVNLLLWARLLAFLCVWSGSAPVQANANECGEAPIAQEGDSLERFYQRMLKDGLPAGAALRAAQLELSKQKRWASPYFWAGFVLHGEWK